MKSTSDYRTVTQAHQPSSASAIVNGEISIVVAVSNAPKAWAFQMRDGNSVTERRGVDRSKTLNQLHFLAAVAALRLLPDGSKVIVKIRLEYVRRGVVALITDGHQGYRRWYA